MPLRSRRALSIRTYFLAIVLVGAIAPLALIGAWLTRSVVRSGEELLREQLDASVASVADAIETRWRFRRDDLLWLANNDVAQRVVSADGAIATPADSEFLRRLSADVQHTIPSFDYRDAAGRLRWSSSDTSGRTGALGNGATRGSAAPTTILVHVPMRTERGGRVGDLEAHVKLDALLPGDSSRLVVPGSAMGVRDHTTGAILMPLSTVEFPNGAATVVHGAPWLVASRTTTEPALDVVVAAPTAAYVAPFKRAGQLGLVSVAIVALIALALSAYLTTRLTRSLNRLVDAASAVSAGDLDRRVTSGGPTEIDSLAGAFNTMTDSLRRTLDELSRRNALAAVGEFAASLAHEVRNALTSVKVDLQRAEEKLPPSPSRELVSRTVTSVARLNSTVTGALQVARSGRMTPRILDVAPVLATAAGIVEPAFTANEAALDVSRVGREPLQVSGDADALQQLFVNLLLNASQSLRSGGRASISATAVNGNIVVAIADNGAGMDAAEIARVVEPFYSTRSGGTGLGLPIARQIATAHGGQITIESEVGAGTTVRVTLPACESKESRRG